MNRQVMDEQERERRFDRQVNFVVWFGIVCLIAGIVITHYWH